MHSRDLGHLVVIKLNLDCFKGVFFLSWFCYDQIKCVFILAQVVSLWLKTLWLAYKLPSDERLSDSGLLKIFLKSYQSLLVCGRHKYILFARSETYSFCHFDWAMPPHHLAAPVQRPAAATTSIPPCHTSFQPDATSFTVAVQASLFSQPTSRACFADHRAATDSNGL